MTVHDELATALEENDAVTVTRLLSSDPSLANSPDWTPPPLHCTVLWNRPEMAEILLAHGADIEMKDPDRSTTPLRWAIVYARKEMVSFLYSQGADMGPINDEGVSAMQLAIDASNGSLEEYEELPRRAAYAEIVELLEELESQQDDRQ